MTTDQAPIVPKLPERLSPSSADTWEGCPKKWWGKYVARISDPAGPAAELGTLVHSALEDLYELPQAERTRQNAQQAIRKHAKLMAAAGSFADVPAGGEVAFFREAWTRLLVIWKVEVPEEIEVISTEQKLHTTVADVPFTGIVDRIERVNGAPVIGDYKTGKRDIRYRESKDRQLQLYVSAVNNALDLHAEQAKLIWLSTTGDVWQVDASPAAVNRTAEWFAAVWAEIQWSVDHDVWPERPGPLCGWCPVLPVCTSGKAEVRWRAEAGKLKETAPAWAIEDQWR